MADFRRWFLAFVALVLVLGSAVPASAQATGPQISCNVNTLVTPTLRHEGLTELVGDILLVCSRNPGSPLVNSPATVPQAVISVSMGGATLSTNTVGTSGGLDALLLVDDPSPLTVTAGGNQYVCASPNNGLACPVVGDSGETYNQSVNSGGHNKYNVFQGIKTPAPGVNSISFLGVPIDPPATGSRTYRITNIRIQGPSVTPGAFGLTPVYAFVSSSSSTSITINQSTQSVVAYVAPGLLFSAKQVSQSFLQCLSYDDYEVGTLTFAEGFPNAFKNNVPSGQNTPGNVYYSESGLQVAVPGGTTGIAATPTELEAVISSVPAGVQIWVDITYTDPNTGITATLISPSTPIAVVGNQAEILDTTALANTATGSVTPVWEITVSNPVAYPSSLVFGVWTTFVGAPGAGGGSPATGVTALAQGGFAPQEATWASGPYPEFELTNGLSPVPGQPLFSVALCQTILLFPYVTDFYGFDTGIAISNTSLDTLPVPASPQTGTCTVNFFGGGGAATTLGTNGVYSSTSDTSLTSGNIAPGQTWAFSLSGIDPGYNSAPTYGTTGYAIAVCNFQFAHGYSFVSDTGIRNFAAAYLALVIPDAPRTPNPFICASAGFTCYNEPGEQLVH